MTNLYSDHINIFHGYILFIYLVKNYLYCLTFKGKKDILEAAFPPSSLQLYYSEQLPFHAAGQEFDSRTQLFKVTENITF